MYLYRAHGSATNKAEVQNNMIITSASSTGTSYGVYIGYGQHINFYHNTINVRGGSATAGRGLYLLGSTSTLYGDVDIKNNIFANSGPGVGAYVTTGAISTFLTGMDYNIFTASGTNLISENGTYHTTLASWQTATTLDLNSLSGLTGFVSPIDLHLQGPLAADAGANVGVMVDFDGDVRPILPSTGYDIGADEYIPPTCPLGSSLSAYNIATTTTDLGYISGFSDTGWIFEYGVPGFIPGTGLTQQVSNDSTTLLGLTQNTNYEAYVRGICSSSDTSTYFGPIAFKTLPTCPLGSSLSAYNIAATTTDLGYISGAADTGWVFEYGSPGFIPGTGLTQQVSNDSTTISGLASNTNYEAYVRGICSLGDTSGYFGPVAFAIRSF